MGKKLISSEQSSAQIKENNNPGCMWGMFQILDYHQWGVKKVFRHKKKINARSAGPLKRLTNLMHQAGNKFCADCGTPEPKWVSSSLGVFICIKCSGIHSRDQNSDSGVCDASKDQIATSGKNLFQSSAGRGFKCNSGNDGVVPSVLVASRDQNRVSEDRGRDQIDISGKPLVQSSVGMDSLAGRDQNCRSGNDGRDQFDRIARLSDEVAEAMLQAVAKSRGQQETPLDSRQSSIGTKSAMGNDSS